MLDYNKLNILSGTFTPSQIHNTNNYVYAYWVRSLFQRAISTIEFDLPENWGGARKDFFYYLLFTLGFVGVFYDKKLGLCFCEGSLSGTDFYRQPTTFKVSNKSLTPNSRTYKIGDNAQIIKLNPDYCGIMDTINYYAEKLALCATSMDSSIINSRMAFVMGAKNKAQSFSLKRIFDKVARGDSCVIYDSKVLLDNTNPLDKGQGISFFERSNIKNSYVSNDIIETHANLLNQFDSEIGIPTLPYNKKERMVTSEAEMKSIDGTSRSTVMFETLNASINEVNKLFNTNIGVKLRYAIDDREVTPNVND